jgi:hypothetical protein
MLLFLFMQFSFLTVLGMVLYTRWWLKIKDIFLIGVS